MLDSKRSQAGTGTLAEHSSKNTGGVSFKVGLVEESKVGFAKVRFPDVDDVITQWLPTSMFKTQDDKGFYTYDIGEQVKCLMDDRLEDGVVLCAIYSDVDIPPTEDVDECGKQFKDGGLYKYNRKTGVMEEIAITEIIMTAPLVTINAEVQINGGVTVTEDVVASNVSLVSHQHTGVTTGSQVSGPPE